MSRGWRIILLAVVAIVAANGWWAGQRAERAAPAGVASEVAAEAPATRGLPPEALATLEAIARGGPFRYDRDGT
ncbi:MAG TPA: hypothetical protein VF055_00255, partial [Steroidobacteraceae bacterium]